jgi:hypothetical protein
MKSPNTKARDQTDQVIATDFRFTVRIRPQPQDADRARKALNLAIVGQENCNVIVDGKMVAAFPDLDDELGDAHHAMNMTLEVTVLADLTRGGHWTNLRIKE